MVSGPTLPSMTPPLEATPADWLTAWSSLAAAIFTGAATVGAGIAASASLRTLKNDSEDRARQRLFERSAQARLVRLGPIDNTEEAPFVPKTIDMQYTLDVTNCSDDAIRSVTLGLFVTPQDCQAEGSLYQNEAHTYERVLAAGESMLVVLSLRLREDSEEPPDQFGSYPAVEHWVHPSLTFTDVSGNRWERGRGYELIERPPKRLR